MNKFNLTFNGEILAGKDPEQVKLGFADMFGIDDPVRLARFFSGKTIVLRRNLERKDAAQLYHQLQLLGAVAALVKVTASDMADEIARNSAREAAALEAQKRQAAEEEARRKAIEEARIAEQERLAEEQRAKEAAEAARLAAEEAARKAEEAAERKRLEEAEAARKKALKAAAKRKAADEAAKRKARRIQEKAQRQAALEEKRRLAAAEEARLKAELEETKRLAAEEKARLKAEREEEQRLAAEEEARVKAELEESKRLAAEEEARRRAAEREMEQRLAALQKKRQEAVTAPIASKVVEPPPGADKVQPRARRPGKATVKTTLDVPLRTRGSTPEVGTPGQRKHPSGAPNLYKLRPFRNSEEVRTRSERARQRMRQAYTAGMFALAVLLITGGSFLQNGDYPVVTGASAVAINANSEPLLLADDLLLVHDRAGVATTEVTLRELGVTALQPPLLHNSADQLFAPGQLLDESETNQFLQCDLVRSNCTLFSTQLPNNSIDAFAINPLDDSLLLADTTAGQLLKVSREGELLSSAAAAIPDNPVLRLRGGLLLMNSAEGPAISVFRYEDNAFGQQLDEILLLPPTALQLELSRVSDFVWSGDAWWVYLRDTGSGAGELHRFDENWNYLSSVPLATAKGPVQLISWGSKTLVNDPTQPSIQRYNAEGEVEAPFDSTLLAELIDAQRQRASFASTAWHGALLTCAVAVLLLFGFGYLHGLRDLVYRSKREQGVEPLDDHAAALHWIEPVQNRQLQLRRTAMRYGGAALLILVLAIMLSVSAWQLGALLLALSGPAIALLLLSRQPVGHIGVLGDRLLLVDHSGQYHLAGGPRLHYCGPFLLIDDIVVYCGSRLLPAFSPASLQRHISPTALGGIKVDYKTIAIKLLEGQHPLALGVLAIAAGVAAAILLLILQRVF